MSEIKAKVYFNADLVGSLSKNGSMYKFEYEDEYYKNPKAPPISLSLLKNNKYYNAQYLFPFFFGLLSEGENKELQCKSFELKEMDYFSILLKAASQDTIGGIRLIEVDED